MQTRFDTCSIFINKYSYITTNLNFRKLVTLRSGPCGPNQRSFRDMSGLCVSLYLSIRRRAGVYVLFIKHMISLAHVINKRPPSYPFCTFLHVGISVDSQTFHSREKTVWPFFNTDELCGQHVCAFVKQSWSFICVLILHWQIIHCELLPILFCKLANLWERVRMNTDGTPYIA